MFLVIVFLLAVDLYHYYSTDLDPVNRPGFWLMDFLGGHYVGVLPQKVGYFLHCTRHVTKPNLRGRPTMASIWPRLAHHFLFSYLYQW